MSTKVIVATNMKGGTAKTTTVLNLAYGLGFAERKVLVIDMDPQCNSSYALAGAIEFEHSMLDVMIGIPLPGNRIQRQPLSYEIIRQATQAPNVWYAPGSLDLVAADLQLGGVPGRELILQRALAPVLKDFEYVIIDTSPHLGLLTVNSMIAAQDTGMIIPVALNTFAIIGFTVLERTAQEIRDNMQVKLPLFGVLPTIHDGTVVSSQSLRVVQERFTDKVFQYPIPKNADIEKAHNAQGCLYTMFPRSKGAAAYSIASQEVINRAEKR